MVQAPAKHEGVSEAAKRPHIPPPMRLPKAGLMRLIYSFGRYEQLIGDG